MSRYDDTIEQIKKKNSLLKNHLHELINDEDNTEINILKQVMTPARPTNDRIKVPTNHIGTDDQKNERQRQTSTQHDRPVFDRFKVNLLYKSDDPTNTKRSHQEYYNKFKENINEIKKTDYQLPNRMEDSKVSDKLKEIQHNDQYDKLELKKKENLLLNKLNEKDEMISALHNKVRTLQQENRLLIDYGNEYKHQLQLEKDQNKHLHKLEIESRQASNQNRNEEIAHLKSKLHGMTEQNNLLIGQNRSNDAEISKFQAAIKDLTIKLIMYKKTNNSDHDKIERLRLINRHLMRAILRQTSAHDDTEPLIDSTTVRLISQPPKYNYFTQNTNFTACDAKMKFKVLIKVVIFINRVQKLCKNEINFKNQMIQFLNND